MRVTTKGRYALRALTRLAMQETEKPTPIKDIAAMENISPEFLEQIFFKLKKAGVINSVRGPGGGFLLAKAPDQITAQEIFEAVGERLDITPCASCADSMASGKNANGNPKECERLPFCHVHAIWADAADHIIQFFGNLTVQEILDRYGAPTATS